MMKGLELLCTEETVYIPHQELHLYILKDIPQNTMLCKTHLRQQTKNVIFDEKL